MRHCNFGVRSSLIPNMQRSDDNPDQARIPLGRDPSVRRLRPREREIAILVARGLSDATIGQTLGISAGSVSIVARRIRLRLKLDSRAELAAWVRARLDPDDPSGGSLRRPPSGRRADGHAPEAREAVRRGASGTVPDGP